MKIIRFNSFETNSSSAHSFIICSKEDYSKWQIRSNNLYFDHSGKLYSKEEVLEIIKNEYPDIDVNNEEELECYITSEFISLDNETFKIEYTSKSGDAIVGLAYEYDN